MKILYFKNSPHCFHVGIFDKIFTIRKQKYYHHHCAIQDEFDVSCLNAMKKLVVFLIPPEHIVNGGIMSIFSLCSLSRELLPDSACVIATFPGLFTYSKNELFANNENIYRWEQIIGNLTEKHSVLIHIPECLSDKFYQSLSVNDLEVLSYCRNLHINILNQNIQLMPFMEKLVSLFSITPNISQTISHDKVMTDNVHTKWDFPAYFLSVYFAIKAKRQYSFGEKEKIIAFSPDRHPQKKAVIKILKNNFPDYSFVEIRKLKFHEFLDLIARAYFVVTFGEGFDGYFTQPYLVGSVGLSSYNEEFFPSPEWKNYETVFTDYEDMKENIVSVMRNLLLQKNYEKIIPVIQEEIQKISTKEKVLNNLKIFYEKTGIFF